MNLLNDFLYFVSFFSSDLSDCRLRQIPTCLYMLMKETTVRSCDFSNNAIKRIPEKLGQEFTNMTGKSFCLERGHWFQKMEKWEHFLLFQTKLPFPSEQVRVMVAHSIRLMAKQCSERVHCTGRQRWWGGCSSCTHNKNNNRDPKYCCASAAQPKICWIHAWKCIKNFTKTIFSDLNVRCNQLSSLHDSLSCCSLQHLDVSHNNLESVPNVVFSLRSLQTLNLSNNKITGEKERSQVYSQWALLHNFFFLCLWCLVDFQYGNDEPKRTHFRGSLSCPEDLESWWNKPCLQWFLVSAIFSDLEISRLDELPDLREVDLSNNGLSEDLKGILQTINNKVVKLWNAKCAVSPASLSKDSLPLLLASFWFVTGLSNSQLDFASARTKIAAQMRRPLGFLTKPMVPSGLVRLIFEEILRRLSCCLLLGVLVLKMHVKLE